MRDQIFTGITRSIADASQPVPGGCADMLRFPNLPQLLPSEIEFLTEAILTALAEVPDGTPAPEPVAAPAQVLFTIDPAMVVARQARQSLTSTEADPGYQIDTAALMDVQTYPAEDATGAREMREFLFAVQEMFGCKVRCVRSGDTERRFIIAGNVYQRDAMVETLDALVEYATPLLNDLTSDERREFWATLGSLVAASDDAEALIEQNRPIYALACTSMTASHGTARALRRAPVATEGAIYDLAASAVPSIN